MGKKKIGDGMEVLLLRECYELAIQYEKLDMVKAVLREKAKRICISLDDISVQSDVSMQESEMQIVSEIIYELTLEEGVFLENKEFKYAYKMEKLSNSAEKEYVMALLSLRKGMGETQRIEALKHLRVALSNSRNDPRFIALADILQSIET